MISLARSHVHIGYRSQDGGDDDDDDEEAEVDLGDEDTVCSHLFI